MFKADGRDIENGQEVEKQTVDRVLTVLSRTRLTDARLGRGRKHQ